VLIHLVQLKCGPGGVPVDHAVGADLGIVAHAAQQAVGDPGGAARAARDLLGAVVAE
jgi:hypothetical protein